MWEQYPSVFWPSYASPLRRQKVEEWWDYGKGKMKDQEYFHKGKDSRQEEEMADFLLKRTEIL